mgnify:FL=1
MMLSEEQIRNLIFAADFAEAKHKQVEIDPVGVRQIIDAYASLTTQLQQQQARADELAGIFGDHDCHPTLEECRTIWNAQRQKIVYLEERLKRYEDEP